MLRVSLRWLLLLLTWAGLLCLPGDGAQAGAPRPPNVVFILADDLGYGALGVYGQTKIKTPNLDRLATEGIRLTQLYAGSHVCAPSRSTLMTGQHTGHTPVRANGKKRHLYAEDVTLAEVLKRAGYVTGGFGKWGLGDADTPGVATKQGFDEWFGQYHQVHAHFMYPFWLWKNETRFPLSENEGRKQARYAPDVTHEQALSFIRRQKDRRFFAYLPYILPHVELTVPDDSRRPYAGAFPKVAIPDPRAGYLGAEDGYATYAGMVSRLDRQVGEVLKLLEELGLERNTLVVFTSDNGPQGSRPWSELVDFFDGNGPLRGSKGDFYEGGLRVPFLARWPGRIKAGVVSDHPAAFWDVLPTLAEVAGTAPPANINGVSILPTLTGRGSQQQHEYFYWEYPYANGLGQACRAGDWKAVIPRPGAPLELYNLRDDPAEAKDVADANAAVVTRLRKRLAEAHSPERDYPPDLPAPEVKDYVR
jgi:arylsulfatase A-like enzyme